MSALISRVEVSIWIAKDKKGNYSGAFLDSKLDRIGHASMKIFTNPEVANSFSSIHTPDQDHFYVSLRPGKFERTHESDIQSEESKPNTIVCLRKLDVSKILQQFERDIDVVNWSLKSKGEPQYHNSATYIMHLLKIGGIMDRALYGKSANQRGPGWTFYYETNCHLGDIMYGFFSWLPWRSTIISPKYVQKMVASAAESDPIDKKITLKRMKSDQVDLDSTQVSAIATAGLVGMAMFGAGYFTLTQFA